VAAGFFRRMLLSLSAVTRFLRPGTRSRGAGRDPATRPEKDPLTDKNIGVWIKCTV